MFGRLAIEPEKVVTPEVEPMRFNVSVSTVSPLSPSATLTVTAANSIFCAVGSAVKAWVENGRSGAVPSWLWSPSSP